MIHFSVVNVFTCCIVYHKFESLIHSINRLN